MTNHVGRQSVVDALSKWANLFGVIMATIAAAAAVWANQRLQTTNEHFDILKQEFAQKAADEQRVYKVYDYVLLALPKDDDRYRTAAQALVTAMLSDRLLLQQQLLTSIGNAARSETVRNQVADDLLKVAAAATSNPGLQNAASLSAFDLQNPIPAEATTAKATPGDLATPRPAPKTPSTPRVSPGPGWKSYRYDLFWCDSGSLGASGRLIAEAQNFARFLESQGTTGRIRIRPLPASVNERTGYKVTGYEVRPEQSEAASIEGLQEQWAKHGGKTFGVHISEMSTPGYVSFFFCP
jgi:hypothetical protein